MADGCGISSDAIEVYNSAEDEWNAATTGNNYDTVRKTLCNGDSYQSYWRMMSPYSYNGSDADQYPINDNTVVTIKAECCSEDFCNEESTGAASLASAAMAALIAVVAAVASF